MPDPSRYEPGLLFKLRQNVLSAPPEVPLPSLAPKEEPISPLERGLELLGRPQAAMSSAMASIFRGERGEPTRTAFMAGLTGQGPYKGMAEVLEAQGMPELGKVGPITGRGVLGFGADIALDPLTYIPVAGWIGKGIKGIGRGAQAALPVVTAVSRGISVGEAVTQIGRPSGVREVAKVAAKIPGIGGITTAVDPRVLSSPIGRVTQGLKAAEESVETAKQALLARFFRREPPLSAEGRMLLPNGKEVAFRDLAQTRHLYKLTPEQASFLDDYISAVKEIHSYPDETLKALRKVNPQAAKDFEIEAAQLASKKKLEALAAIEKEADWVPSYVVNRTTGQTAIPYKKGAKGFGPATYQFERQFIEQEKAIAEEGWRYMNPVEALGQFMDDAYRQAHLMELSMELGKVAKMQGAQVSDLLGKRLIRLGEELGEATDKDVIRNLKHSMRDTKRAIGKVERGNWTPVEGLAQVQRRGLENLWFSPKEATELEEILTRTRNPIWAAAADAAAVPRTLSTGIDLSAMFIQGLPTLANNPVRWAQGVWHSIRVAFDPARHQAYLALPKAQRAVQEVRNLILGGGSAEYYAGIKPTGLLGKLAVEVPGEAAWKAVPRGIFRRIMEETYGRGAAAFDAFGDFARIEWVDSLLPTARRAGGNALWDVGNLVNHGTGVLSTKAMGISPTQRDIEGGFLFFASRYLRSSLALVGDALSGGLKGSEARKSLGTMAMLGPLMYYKTCLLLDQEPIMDPGDSRMFTIQVGNERIGVGTIWVALVRLMARAAVNAQTGEWDFTQAFEFDARNPLVQFWKGRTSPLTSAIWDTVSKESYLGDDLTQPLDLLTHLGSRLLPFTLQALLLENQTGTTEERLAGFGAEVLGMRAYPSGYQETRDTLAMQQFGKKFDELDPYQKVEITRSPKLQEMPLRGVWGKEEASRREILTRQETEFDKLAGQVESGEINKDHYRVRRAELFQRYAMLLGEIQEPREPEERERWLRGLQPNERAFQQYMELLRTKGEYGETPYEAAEAFYAQLPDAIQQYIEDKRLAGIGRFSPRVQALEREYRQVVKLLRPYWDIRDEVMESRGLKAEYDAMTPAERDVFEQTRQYKRAMVEWTRRRDRMRRRNREVKAALVAWYGYSPSVS